MAMTASLQVRADLVQGHVLAVLLSVQFGDDRAVGGDYLGGLGHLVVLQVLEAGEPHAGVEPEEEAAHQKRQAEHEDHGYAQEYSHRSPRTGKCRFQFLLRF